MSASRPGEFDLIARIARRVQARGDVVLGIGDDAALLEVPAGRQLVVAMDTLNAGVHFPHATAPADIGWKALAVNLSDLAAMGAEPAWCTLSLSMPTPDAAWLDGFLEGFSALASMHRVALVGGDTTRGPLSVCVTVQGLVEPGRALRRDAARPGDEVWVSGALGDAAAALSLLGLGPLPAPAIAADAAARAALHARLDRPTPRIALGRALAPHAHAAIDVSDGLLADLAHLARASGTGVEVEVDRLPASDALCALFDADARRLLQAAGGDDYELAFTAAAASHDAVLQAAAQAGTPVTCVGRVVAGQGVSARDARGAAWLPPRRGWEHFAD